MYRINSSTLKFLAGKTKSTMDLTIREGGRWAIYLEELVGLEVVAEGGDEVGCDAALADLLRLELLPKAVRVRGQLLALLHAQLRPRQPRENE